MKKTKKTPKQKISQSSKLRIVQSGPSIFEVAHYMHETIARYCEYCGRPMSPSDVNDYGSLCEDCYMKEYY